MKNAAIIQTVTHYLAKNFENLENAMPSEKYFFIRGTSTGERSHAEPRIAIGTAIDVLADTIEKKQFFGWYVPSEVSQATNSSNAGIKLLDNGEDIYGRFEVQIRDGGLFIPAENVGKRDYLNVLRTPEGFKQAAELLGIEENLEKIASTIYED